MSKLPTWMTGRLDSTVEALADLSELGRWLDDPAKRLELQTAKRARDAELITAERELTTASYGLNTEPADQVVALRERVEQAKGRAGLIGLAEELAERTRLRVTVTISRAGRDGAVDESPRELRELARQINTGIRGLVTDLAESDVAFPAEAFRSTEAALHELNNRRLAVDATASPRDLRRWAEDVELALNVLGMAPTTRA